MGKNSRREISEKKQKSIDKEYRSMLKALKGYKVVRVVRSNTNGKKLRVTRASKLDDYIVPDVGPVKMSKKTCMSCIKRVRKWDANDRELWKKFGIINCPKVGGVYIDEDEPPEDCICELEQFIEKGMKEG